MLNEIYNKRILELAADIPHGERLVAPNASATAVSRLCGSRITVDLKLEGDRVSAYGADVRACALGQAAASIMARHVIDASVEELREVGQRMRGMLKEGAEPPRELCGGKWKDLEILESVREYKARHASTLLVFDAVEEALETALANQGSGTAAAQTGTPTSTGPAH